MLNVQIINKSKHPLPAYATELSAGMDIRANLNEPISLAPMRWCLVPTAFISLFRKDLRRKCVRVVDLPLRRGLPC